MEDFNNPENFKSVNLLNIELNLLTVYRNQGKISEAEFKKNDKKITKLIKEAKKMKEKKPAAYKKSL